MQEVIGCPRVKRQYRSKRTVAALARPFVISILALVGARFDTTAAQQAITTSVSDTRYYATHGTAGFLGGSRAAGVEAYVYPLQIFRDLQVRFRVQGTTAWTDGASALRSYTYAPTFFERDYMAGSAKITEHLSMAMDLPAGVLEFTQQSSVPVSVEVSFVPVLNLMWPAGIGGQEARWDADLHAYVLEEPTHRFTAIIGSAEAEEHDPPSKSNLSVTEPQLRMALRASPRARLVFAASTHGFMEAAATFTHVERDATAIQAESLKREEARRLQAIEITTPNEEVNQALAWAGLAIDQAWACNPVLGCGLLAGYGPSRGIARRPQYAWFFAGDALVSLRAMLDCGSFEHARQELLFLLRYQDAQSGMMWHELSQSAGYLRWMQDYPYMFGHVDITPTFLNGVADYLRATGDVAFVRDHWDPIERAFGYTNGLLDRSDGLPRVPAGKVAHDEQQHPQQELELAMDCLRGARAFAFLARETGHVEEAKNAEGVADRLTLSIQPRFWNAATGLWNTGIAADGRPVSTRRLPPPDSLGLLTKIQRASVLQDIASPNFSTAWGVRNVAADSIGFNPADYASGSVWAKATALASLTLWQYGKPQQGWETWQKLLPWITLDSAGHVHEVMSGVRFEPQRQSVPEQTWSSALMLSSFLEGMLGIRLDATQRQLEIAPQMPPEWRHLSVKRLRVGSGTVDLEVVRHEGRIDIFSTAHDAPLRLVLSRPAMSSFSSYPVFLNGRRCFETTPNLDSCVAEISPIH